jgi:DNA polymerase-3 subunit alpha
MEGQTVAVAGMVDSVRNLLTRDRQPSASVVLEDLDGKLEVIVWPRVYAATQEYWKEGNILVADGKVRLRGDRVQLICEHVRYYQLEESRESEGLTSHSQKIAAPVIEDGKNGGTTNKTRKLVIRLKQTSDKSGDIARLHQINNILRDYPGYDETNLMVDNGKKVFKLRLSAMRVDYCPQLHQRLVEVIGEDAIKLETENS